MKQASTTSHLPQACPQWATKLNALHHDDLPFEKRLQLRKHLETCANCQAARAEYRAMDALITGLSPVEPMANMPPRLRELIGVNEETPHLRELIEGDDAILRLPHSDSTPQTPNQAQFPVNKHLPRYRARRRATTLNRIATVLVVSALVAGFFVLHASHPSNNHTLIGSSRHTTRALQHNTYLNVIIGNGHGDTYAVDPSSGTIAWKHQAMTEPANNPFSTNGILYYSGVNNVLYAIDGGNGEPLWHTQLALPNQNYRIGWTLVTDNDLIFVTTENVTTGISTLHALDTFSGATIWQKNAQAQASQLLAATNGVLYIDGDGLSAWSEKDGHLLWHNPQITVLGSNSMVSALSVVIANGKLYGFAASSYAQGSDPLKNSNQIEVVDTSTGHLLNTLTIDTASPQALGFAVNETTLYVAMNNGTGTPSLRAYSLSNEHLLWHKEFTNRRITNISATTQQIYIGIQGPKTAHPQSGPTASSALLALKSSDGSQIWNWPDTTSPGMLVAAVEINGVVCVVDGGVVGIQADSGHLLWRTTFSQATGFPPIID